MATKKKVTKKKTAKKKTAAKKKRRARKSQAAEKLAKRAKSKKAVAPAKEHKFKFNYEVTVVLENGDEEVRTLTHKQLMFCYEYLSDYNKGRAAKRAGYAEASAVVQGSILFKNPMIQAKLLELQEADARVLAMNASEVAMHMSSIGRFDIRNLYDEAGERLLMPHELDDHTAKCVSGIKVSRIKDRSKDEDDDTEETVLEYKINDKNAALSNRARALGVYVDKTEVEVGKSLKELFELADGADLGPPSERKQQS